VRCWLDCSEFEGGGGAYLPLDPTYPVLRLQSMMQDARPMLLVRSSASQVADELIEQIPQLSVDSREHLSERNGRLSANAVRRHIRPS